MICPCTGNNQDTNKVDHQICKRLGLLRRPMARRRTTKMKQKRNPWMLVTKPVKILRSTLEISSTSPCTCPSKLKNEKE